ncbi:MAG: hypothetical protein J6U26_05965, partial [Lachnospiraceae bacterium]|nr:hypothetical protein [Lachnospiraceae bacterium]
MKKILKRSFAVLLSLLLCFGSLHIRVAADGEEGVPGAAGPGVITFVNHTGLEDGESYLLTEDAGGTFTVAVRHESAAEDVVLVVESPAYGLAFAALPKAGAGIAEAVLLDPHTMAIRLAPSKKAASFAVDLRLKKVPLTIEQAADLMDGKDADARIACSEYTLDADTPLDEVLEKGTLVQTEVCLEAEPALPEAEDAAIELLDNYCMFVSSVPALTDRMLSDARFIFADAPGTGYLRYGIPALGAEDSGLAEITGIKVYVPDSRLVLERLSDVIVLGEDGEKVPFDVFFKDWVISERMEEVEEDPEETDGEGGNGSSIDGGEMGHGSIVDPGLPVIDPPPIGPKPPLDSDTPGLPVVPTPPADASAAGGKVVSSDEKDPVTPDLLPGEEEPEEPVVHYYYLITPPEGARFFNIGEGGTVYFGMGLVFRLEDSASPLDTEEDGPVLYRDLDTTVYYRLQGDEEDREFTHEGPAVETVNRRDGALRLVFETPDGVVARSADAEDLADLDVVMESYRTGEFFGGISLEWYLERIAAEAEEEAPGDTEEVKDGEEPEESGEPEVLPTDLTESVPDFRGTITETYEFPYEIQPRRIHFTAAGIRYLTDRGIFLSGISYVTESGEAFEADEEEIGRLNALLFPDYAGEDAEDAEEGTDGIAAEFAECTDEDPVRKVVVTWTVKDLSEDKEEDGDAEETLPEAVDYADPLTIYTYFDFFVSAVKDADGTPAEDGDLVQVRYEAETVKDPAPEEEEEDGEAASEAPEVYADSAYFWFRMASAADPDLVAGYPDGADGDAGANALGSDDVRTIGGIGFDIGRYGEKRDFILDPEITLDLLAEGITGFPEDAGVSLLTGGFTALPLLEGWKITYTTALNGTETFVYTVGGVIPEEGRRVQLPLAEGDAFTSLKLSYDGEVSLAHTGLSDTASEIWLLKDIEVRTPDANPVNGEEMAVSEPYGEGLIFLNATVTYSVEEFEETDAESGETVPHCGCEDDLHVKGQDASGTRPFVAVYGKREATAEASFEAPEDVL